MTCRESLEKYQTTVFGFELMARYITKIDSVERSIDCSTWYAMIPKIYRPAAMVAAQNILWDFLGRPLTPQLMDAFICELHREVWRELDRGDYMDENLN